MSERKSAPLLIEGDMSHAQRQAYRQGLATSMEMPFEQLLRREDDGLPHGADYQAEEDEVAFALKRAGVRAMMRRLIGAAMRPGSENLKPAARFSFQRLMKAFFQMARAMGMGEVVGLSYEDEGMMFGESKAAVSWRLKRLSEELEAAGLRGYKLPGQKKDTPEYSKAQKASQGKNGANRSKGKRPALHGKHPTSNHAH